MSSITQLTPGTWNVDVSHSTIGFVARHLMVTKVRGRFESFSGTITVADEPLASTIEASVDMKSVSTGDTGRDGHLVSGDFFDVDQFPTMTFTSTGITPDGDDFELRGDLTIKGVTRPVTFDLEFEGVATDPWGNTKAAFTASTEINRRDFGLDWNVALDQGGMLVSEKIKVELDIQAVKA
ncbi:MAG: YceI family protein [Ilumatobacteraceae bacterium]